MFKGLICDLEGTVYLGERLIPGAERTIRRLRERGKKIVFLSSDYRNYNIAVQAIKKGARFIATNPDWTCSVEDGAFPDCTGVIAALDAVTLKKAEVVVGQPSPITVQAALDAMSLEAADCLLISDRLETDIRMGLESGMKTALVLSGVTDAKVLDASPIRPDYVFQSIADLEFLLR
jgi:arabinose operon protein AraL